MPLKGDAFNRNILTIPTNNCLYTAEPHMVRRFSEVAYLASVRRLDICGTIDTKRLSPKTEYVAYLVFMLANRSNRLESAKSSIRFVNYESEIDTEN
ncbi:hypothetical protein H5410_052456 [Solanum commersonii]|uniref:Uncharacterized protein n=1 Tax=Solanum commersonii TaxID=4109 RepID=A0A9J5X331_SOLCO|nr:hypothetical protein H5410_052456 [Solanum commersonii]